MLANKLYLIVLSMIVLAPLISAAWGGWSGYYYSPVEYLNNEWVLFGIITIVFFAIIFYTVNKSFQNPAVSSTIAMGLSLLIGMAFSQRMLLYGYAGEELGAWVLIVVSLISIGFLIKFVYEGLGNIGAIAVVIGIWFILHNIDPYQVFPYQIQSEIFLNFFEFMTGIFGLIILIIAAILLSRTKQDQTLAEQFGRVLFKRR
jgi:hypothetical protein